MTAAADPSPNLFIAFRSADAVSEEDVRSFLEKFGPAETLSIPKRKDGESRLCFVSYESEAKATEVMNAIISNGDQVNGERPLVRYNLSTKDTRRRTVGGGGGGFGGGPGSSSSFGGQQRRDDSKFGSQSSLNMNKSIVGGGGDPARSSSRGSVASAAAATSQFYANKDLDLARLVIKVETSSGVRHIECQPDCFNLMKQFMTAEELDTGIQAFAISGRQQPQQQQAPVPVPIRAEQSAPVTTINGNGRHSAHNGLSQSSSPQQLMPPPPPMPRPSPQAAPASAGTAVAAALVATAPVAAVPVAAAPVAAAPIRRFEPRSLAPGVRLSVKLIEFPSVSQFTAMDSNLADKHYQQIDDLMNRLYNSTGQQSPAGQPVSDAKPGDCVCAVWAADGKYYRSVVREASGGRLTVFFFDDASIDDVQAAKVRTMSPELIDLPNLALLCRLDGVPDSEFNRLKTRLQAVGFAVELEIVRCNGFECSVRLYLGNECLNNTNNSVPAAAAVPAAPAPSAPLSLPVRSVEPNREFQVMAMEAESPAELGLMLADCQADYLTVAALLAQINANGGANLQPLPALPPVGSVCLAKWASDNNFYRARVIQSAADRCRLFFLDDGNTDTAGLDQLKQLPADLMVVPPVALRCRAANVANVRLAKQIVSGCEMIAVFAAGEVAAGFDASLVSLRFATDKSDAFVLADSTCASSTTLAADSVSASAVAVDVVDSSDNSQEVRIVLMNSPLDFVVQRTDKDAEYEKLCNELDAYCRQGAAPCQPADLQINGLVAAPYMGVYFRAKITELAADNSCAVVYFIDYGNMETVPFVELRKLDTSHVTKPAWSKRCRLNRIAAASSNGQWPESIQADVLTKLGKDTAILRLAPPEPGASSCGSDIVACDLATEQCSSLCQALVAAGLAAIVID